MAAYDITLTEATTFCASLASSSIPSEYLRDISAAQDAAATTSRALTEGEVAALRANGNRASNWAGVRVRAGCSSFSPDRVVGCVFGGAVLLGSTDGTVEPEPGVALEAGLRGSTVIDAVVGDGALVADTRLLARVVVGPGAVVLGCGTVACGNAGTRFGNGLTAPVGVEVGGRDVACFAEMRFGDAVAAGAERTDAQAQKAYAEAVAAYAARAQSRVTVVGAGTRVLHAPRVYGAFLGPGARVEAATVEEATLLSSPAEPAEVSGGAVVRGCLLQWASAVESLAFAEGSVLFEHSHVERHGKLIDSLLGPNSGVAEGEVTSSLVGPFVGFHHQALLIACFWPDGKGNVGYGANVGSNHTLKAPDQELWPGEGCFFGLGTCIKYPANFRQAPYTVVATGVTTLPQVVTMPFSLINMAGESIMGLSPAINEIMPAWVLSDALYSVLRNEDKFAKRNKADPARNRVDAEVLKPRVVDWMLAARAQLREAAGKARLRDAAGAPVYTDKECTGIGKNYMTEHARAKAVSTYTFFARLYALRELAARLGIGVGDDAAAAAAAVARSGDVLQRAGSGRWEHGRRLLLAEFGAGASVPKLLAALASALAEVAASAESSKSRDDKRGKLVIPDYDLVHKPVAGEPVVVIARRLADDLKAFASKL